MSKEEFVNDVLEGNLSHAWSRLVDYLNTDFKTGILSLIDGVDTSGGETAWSITKQAVASEETTDKTNEEKHQSAKDAILSSLLNSGINAAASIVDILIKLAVREMKWLSK